MPSATILSGLLLVFGDGAEVDQCVCDGLCRTLDDKNAVAPAGHGWDGDRPRWLCLADGLPRFEGDPDYDS